MKNQKPKTNPPKTCNYCDSQGYIVIRDCSGEIQREETCSFCSGTGLLS